MMLEEKIFKAFKSCLIFDDDTFYLSTHPRHFSMPRMLVEKRLWYVDKHNGAWRGMKWLEHKQQWIILPHRFTKAMLLTMITKFKWSKE